MMRISLLFLLICLAMAACAQQPARRQAPSESIVVQPRVAGAAEAEVDATPEAALQRARAALEQRGFTLGLLASPTGTLEAEHAAQATSDWATCPTITLRDPFSEALRSRRTNAGEVSTRVTVKAAAAEPSGTRVAVRALSVGSYVNGFTGTPQQGACRSTGILEQELIEAMRADSG
jgi:hypothetical protein